MRILFIHNNFPGQYKRIVERLKDNKKYELVSASLESNKQKQTLRHVGYKLHREVKSETHHALRYSEKAVLNGQATLKALLELRQQGFKPDIVLSHSGWGPSLFIKDAWPKTKHLSYFEWYYGADVPDVGFLDNKRPDVNERMRIRMKSTAMLHDLASMDWGQCPTRYQASTFPTVFQERFSILHDGVDTEYFSPAENATFTIKDKVFRRGDPLITYIARGMEPYRGFPQFIEAITKLQRQDPNVHAVVIGEDRVAYGAKRGDGKSWKEAMVEEFKPDPERLHFLGYQPLSVLRDVLRVSAGHVYLTVPFVLSWSMMEAMSTGALIIGSATGPVEEMIEDGKNGVLVPFFDTDRLVTAMQDAVARPEAYESHRIAARRLILEHYEVEAMTARYLELINSVASGQRPKAVMA